MNDHEHADAGAEHGTSGEHADDERTTAPMSEFTAREAGLGAAVALVGLLFAVVVPLVLAL